MKLDHVSDNNPPRGDWLYLVKSETGFASSNSRERSEAKLWKLIANILNFDKVSHS